MFQQTNIHIKKGSFYLTPNILTLFKIGKIFIKRSHTFALKFSMYHVTDQRERS